MARIKEGDMWRWLSVSEETLLLHSDLDQFVGHISLPNGVGAADAVTDDEIYGLPVLDGKSPEELVSIITRECNVRSTTYTSLMEYRHNALKELWFVLLEKEKNQTNKKQDDAVSSGNGAKTTQKGEGFASRVSLVLIFPILKSLCRIDPKLSQETAGLLLESLQACDPLSLSSEPSDCINGLENILCSWLKSAREDGDLEEDVRERQLQTAASALVALAVAVGTGSLLLRTVRTLQLLESLHSNVPLLVPKILHKLLQEHVVSEEPIAITVDNHLICWSYEEPNKSSSDGALPRSIAYDRQCLYVTSTNGQELLKLGTGYNGTMRGYIYNKCKQEEGWITYTTQLDSLLYKKASSDNKPDQPFLSMIDRTTLKETSIVRTDFTIPTESIATLNLISDGLLLYWLYYLKEQDVVHPWTGEKVKQHLVFVQILQIEEREPSSFYIVSTRDRILLSKPVSDDPRVSSDVVKSFIRSGGTSYSLSALLGAKDGQATSCGLALKQIQSGSVYCTGSSLVLITAPPPNTGSSRSLFGVTGASSKALCYSFCYNLSTGVLASQSDLPASAQLHCGLTKGGSIQTLAYCYDHIDHCLWSVTDEWVDLWTCIGKVKPAPHLLALRMGKSCLKDLIPDLPDSDTVSITDAILLLLRHSGIMSCRLTPAKDISLPAPRSLISILDNCCGILEYSLDHNHIDNCLSIIITLEAVLPSYLSSTDKHSQDTIAEFKNRIKSSVSKLLQLKDITPAFYSELKKLICYNCEHLYFNNDKCADEFISLLLSSPQFSDLANQILIEIASRLRHSSQFSPAILRLMPLIGNNLEHDSLVAMETLDITTAESAIFQPVFPPTLQCASAVLNLSLRSLNNALENYKIALNKENNDDNIENATRQIETQRNNLISVCDKLRVFELCGKTLQRLMEWANNMTSPVKTKEGVANDSVDEANDNNEEKNGRSPIPLNAFEKACKGTVLGAFLPPLLAVLSNDRVCSQPLATMLLKHLTKLGRQCAELCSVLYKSQKKVQIPAPWASGRTVETIHPVRDNYKFKETVSFPGAKHLFLKFDQRCSSQYDYDKIMIYSGDSVSSPKVVEYGGNTHGFGSRSVLGKGWPKELVKINGDAVTFTFEMKSGREHSTPDKAMWGFCCTVRPQEIAEDSPLGLPFLLDLYLSVSSVSCSLIGQLFDGAPPTEDEKQCEALMKSSLLQRCVWSDTPTSGVSNPAPSLLPAVIEKIRTILKKPRPALRQSISEILQIDLLEDVILSTCLKHHGITFPLSVLMVDTDIGDNQQLLEDIFTHINGLERRLQALCELESKWATDVEEIATESDTDVSIAFFHEFLNQEPLIKSFELLCCLMGVDPTNGDVAAVKDLQSLMEKDVQCYKENKNTAPSKIKKIVNGVIDRSRLLLRVNISTASPSPHSTPPSNVSRSLSVPAHRYDARSLRRQHSDGSGISTGLLIDIMPDHGEECVLNQIFQFIGTKPEEAVKSISFLSAAAQQRDRAVSRVQGLEFLQSLLTGDQLATTIEHILGCVSRVLHTGPHVSDISCSGLVNHVRDAFANVMLAVVELASHQPVSCINTISLLSIIPYTYEEESCLVRSGLVKLLDHLCSLSNLPASCDITKEEGESEEDSEALQRVTALAWAAFQVLADRCVSWETGCNGFLSSGLAQQVSLLLTNHLSRAMETLVTSESGTSETLQEALSMLLGLARSHMGRTILSQPACVSKLLLLLTDQRPSPKLVLIALQLCRVALPLMTIAECSQVTIPSNPTFSSSLQSDNLASNIITLLMAKLAEYLVPNLSQPIAKQISDENLNSSEESALTSPPQVSHNEMDENGQASVYIYRRKDESAADLLQLLLNHDPRQRSLNIDNVLKEEGKAEIHTDTYRACFRRALRWANMGFLVSIEPPVGGSTSRGPSGTESDIKKAKAESYCKKKNLDLLKTDPPRPFLSGTVAYSLAAEIIGLLNGLLADPGAAQVWKKAIQNVLQTSLEAIPSVLPELEHYCNTVISAVREGVTPPSPDKYLSVTCLGNATFAALGGFKDIIRSGMRVRVLGDGIDDCTGTVISISERRGVANVQFNDDQYCFGSNRTLEAPLCRLTPPEVDSLSLSQLNLQKYLCNAMVAMVTTQGPTVTDPHSGMDASPRSMGLCRLFAELRSRAFLCLSHHVSGERFRNELLTNCNIIEFVKQSEGCQSGERLSVIETHCLGLRMLYRDCARPSAPKIEKPRVEHRRYHLDLSRSWPPVKSCSFSHNLTSVVYQGPTTSTGGGVATEEGQDKPKGALILTTEPIPRQAPSFYWEVELTQVESGSNSPHLTMGYCPDIVKVEGQEVWSYPDGTCLLRSSGRGCHVLGDDRMKWKKINLDTPLKTGDIMGCGWMKEDTPEMKGVVYFTVNGVRMQQQFKDAPPNMFPFLQLQKKSIRVKANFGDTAFLYTEGHVHRDAADVPFGETIEEIVSLFKELPFHPWDEEEDEEPQTQQPTVQETTPDTAKHEPLVVGPLTKTLTVPALFSKESSYNNSSSLLYPLRQSFDTMIESGPLIRPGGGSNQEEDEEEGESRGAHAEEDLHALLVKAWETKVFPKIQRRFRNDQERKSGLEQIKGALQLGMETIAQETVEFLYEENGGLPKDLYFPTIDDVRTDLEKFTINRVKKGSAVVILKEFPYTRCGVRAMQKTQGLTGIVLSVDKQNELVQVECYIPSDGALVRFWYPVIYLEKPPKGYRKPSALRGAESVNILVHRELLQCELSLSAMYCRSCLVTLHMVSVTRPSPIPVPTFLSLVTADNLSQPSVEGVCITPSSSLSPTLSDCLATVLSSPENIFYSNLALVKKVCLILLSDPPHDLVYIISEICTQMAGTVEGCGYGEYTVSDGKDSNDVFCPKGSFVVVSSLEEKPKSDSKPSYKYPWGKVFVYRGGQSKAGQKLLQEVIRYPNEIPQSTTHQYCGPAHPCYILPTNRVHLKLGGCSPHPGRQVAVVGVSELLPLVMTLADILSRKVYNLQMIHKTNDIEMTTTGLSYTILPLIKTMCRIDCPPVLKERMFQTLSNSLWTLSYIQSINASNFPFFPAKFLSSISQELEQLYEFETAAFTANKSTKFPPEGLINAGGLGKFSTYFQILLELVVATQYYTSIYHQSQTTPTTDQKKSTNRKDSSSSPIKNKSWLKYVTRIVDLLQRVVQKRPIKREFYDLFKKSLPIKAETKLLVLTGLNTKLQKDEAIEVITSICNRHSGIVSNGLYLPCNNREVSTASGADTPNKETTPTTDDKTTPTTDDKTTPTTDDTSTPTTDDTTTPSIDDKTTPTTDDKTTSSTGDKTASDDKATPTTVTKSFVCGRAVLELQCSEKTSVASESLLASLRLLGEKKELAVSCVSRDLKCGDDTGANEILREYLHDKLFEGKSLKQDAKTVLSVILNMAAYDNGRVTRSVVEDKANGDSYLRLLLTRIIGDKDMKKLLTGIYEGKKGAETVNESKLIQWIEKEAKRDIRNVWCGLQAVGYDFHYQRCGFLPSDACLCSPNTSKDHALALHVDSLCRKLGVVSVNLRPWDMTVAETDLTADFMTPLQNTSHADITLRFMQLRQLNRQLSWLLPLVDLCSTHPASLGSFLSCVRDIFFYDSKISFLHSVLNSSTRRSLDQAPPEIKMDPLETVGGLPSSVLETQFCQAARQMLTIPSPQLCVSLASGGDPTYAFNVKLAGEEVHGTSGSFRHFLWQVVKELQSSLLPILMMCPSHSAGINRGKYILAPGPMGYSEEKLLQFFGQLLGVAIRADVPVAIDLLDCFWKSIKQEELTIDDLREADSITYSITQKIIEASNETMFIESVVGIFHKHSDGDDHGQQLRFTYQNMSGIEEEICAGGFDIELNFANRFDYGNAVRRFRLKELSCKDRMIAVQCGIASVLPLQVLRVMTANDLNLRVCGIPDVDLQYLKLHTTYHVGLMEEDQHIKYFWNALETFSQEEMRKFIKFACNQERIPFGEPCRGMTDTVMNVPPYPMKIAPPDGTDPPDGRYIRAETCMFLVKLPQYSSQTLMTERLKYAINCREDPLSG